VLPDPAEGAGKAWLLVHPSAVPEHWRDRASLVSLIKVRVDDAAGLLADGPSSFVPAPAPAERRLRDLLAAGTSRARIAAELAMSTRTLDRRLRALRDEVGARTLPELTAALIQRGYGPRRRT
jgi:cytochrome P450